MSMRILVLLVDQGGALMYSSSFLVLDFQGLATGHGLSATYDVLVARSVRVVSSRSWSWCKRGVKLLLLTRYPQCRWALRRWRKGAVRGSKASHSCCISTSASSLITTLGSLELHLVWRQLTEHHELDAAGRKEDGSSPITGCSGWRTDLKLKHDSTRWSSHAPRLTDDLNDSSSYRTSLALFSLHCSSWEASSRGRRSLLRSGS